MNSSSSTRPERAARRPWLAVSAVGLATFSVVTTEMLPVGLLTSIAGSLGTSMGRAGLMISLPALLAALFAPLVVMAAGGMDRRRILCGLLALLVLANLASALAPSLIWLLAARVLVGFCMGGIWAIAGGLAARLVPQASMGLATSIIFGGVAAASVLGVPLGALIGELFGWRWAFGSMALLAAAVLALHLAVIPGLPPSGTTTLRQFGHQLGNRALQRGLMLTFLLVEVLGGFLDKTQETTKAAAQGGLGAFLYLEVLDASFSFDGVIGAFALSQNLFVIAIGLGIGQAFQDNHATPFATAIAIRRGVKGFTATVRRVHLLFAATDETFTCKLCFPLSYFKTQPVPFFNHKSEIK